MKKTTAQLDREIGTALAKRPARSALSPKLCQVWTRMVEDAETDGAENLFLSRGDEGYTGDPKEFRFSAIFARRIPCYKYERLVDYIEQYGEHPHEHLGRALTAREADRLLKEAGRIRDEELTHARENT